MIPKLVKKMGRTTLLGTALLAGALVGCSDSTGPDAEAGSIEATWAGQPWSGDAWAVMTLGDTLYVGGATPRGAGPVAAGGMRARVVFHGPDRYTLGAGDAGVDYLVGGDVLTARYVTPRANAGTLEVTEYGDGWIAGRVSFDAEAVPGYSSTPVGAAARFQGTFRAQVRTLP